MDEGTRQRLDELKAKQKQKQQDDQIAMEKRRLISEIEGFERHYRFADVGETERIDTFIDALPEVSPTGPDFSKLVTEREFQDVSDYLLLVFDNLEDFIYIDDTLN